MDKQVIPPKIIEELHYEEILKENIDLLKPLIKDWEPHESDTFMLILEAFSYKELFLRKRINESIYSMLLPWSTGADLDNLGALFGVTRLEGEKPKAKYKLTLSDSLSKAMTIPSTLILVDENLNKAELEREVTVPHGQTSVEAYFILDKITESSSLSPKNIISPIPYLSSATPLEPFSNGVDRESDEKYRERIVLSLQRFTTAGSTGSYIYHTRTCDKEITDVKVYSPSPGVVEVIYLALNSSDLLKNKIEAVLNDHKVRPLTDKVIVRKAKEKNIEIRIEITPYKEDLINLITQNIKNLHFNINERLPLGTLYKNIQIDGVLESKIISPSETIKVERDEVIVISSIEVKEL